MKVVSLRQQPQYLETAIAYFQKRWGSKDSMMVYDNCLRNCIAAKAPLPQWYLLVDERTETVAGCAGLITNDFISRMDLYPWACALFVEPEYRGHAYGSMLLQQAESDAAAGGFTAMYLCTDHIGYYEKYGFCYIGDGYHPWGESSRIYEIKL